MNAKNNINTIIQRPHLYTYLKKETTLQKK